MIDNIDARQAPRLLLIAALWAAQALVAIVFVGVGWMKLSTPIAQLAGSIPWAGELPELFVRSIGAIDIAGGLGIVLPALTRIQPRLTVFAAGGCAALQICAILFHLARGEGAATPLNFVLLGLSAFVFWGRRGPAVIQARG